MFLNPKWFDRLCLPRTAILVGCLHILGSSWNIIGAVYGLSILDQENPEYADILRVQHSITTAVALVFGFAGMFLITGTFLKSHLMLLPWLILEAITLVIYFVNTSIGLFSMNTRDWSDLKLKEVAVSMVYLSIIALCVYVWFAILQFYQVLRDEKQKPVQADEEKLVSNPVLVRQIDGRPLPPPYFIPIAFTDPKQPPSLIKY